LQFVILVVDSTDRERLSISKEELHKMLACEVGPVSHLELPYYHCSDIQTSVYLVFFVRMYAVYLVVFKTLLSAFVLSEYFCARYRLGQAPEVSL